MNTPRSKSPQRYALNFPRRRPPGGHYVLGVSSEFAQAIGNIVVQWSQLEEAMILVLSSLLGDIHQAPARQIFRSLNSEQTRLKVMRSLLHTAKINRNKPKFFDDVIGEFAALNKVRNAYAHGLWATHHTGRVFLAEATDDNEMPFYAQKPMSLKQVQHTLKRIGDLIRKVRLETWLAHEPPASR